LKNLWCDIFASRAGDAGSLPKRTDQNRSDEMTSGAQFNFAQRYRVAKKFDEIVAET
jgi:hypothetical protein